MLGRSLSEIHAKPTNITELKNALLSVWNDLPQDFIDKAMLSFRRFDRALLQLVNILNTQFKPRGQLTFITEMFKLMTKKAVQSLIRCY